MTGFGRGEKVYDTRKYNIEIKSVNSRFCDISIRMPRIFNYLDGEVRRVLGDRLLRGKIDVFINYEDQGEAGQSVTVNSGLAKEYSEAAKAISAVTGITRSHFGRFIRNLASFKRLKRSHASPPES